jgi:hypothetical protein
MRPVSGVEDGLSDNRHADAHNHAVNHLAARQLLAEEGHATFTTPAPSAASASALPSSGPSA